MNQKRLQLSTWFFCFAVLCAVAGTGSQGQAEPLPSTEGNAKNPATKGKSSFNTQVYEQDSTEQAFSATVKFVREVRGSWEVLFEGKPGVYSVDDAQQNLLVESQKYKTSVSVKVDSEAMKVISVQASPRAPASSGKGDQNPLGK